MQARLKTRTFGRMIFRTLLNSPNMSSPLPEFQLLMEDSHPMGELFVEYLN